MRELHRALLLPSHLPCLTTLAPRFPELVTFSLLLLAGTAASRRSTFGVLERCAPEPCPNPVLARFLSNPMATVADGTLGPAAGPTPVTILATLAALTPRALLARAGTFSPWREAEGHRRPGPRRAQRPCHAAPADFPVCPGL